ncbi:Uncharacterised protein [BD1-7 clade bacterium]|uniref:RDD domain-containing protein n=1 Tax=BD1-7 clade bacterium TaxID=2029982 RepID=A0A5S9Q0J1_9GAMM|nr:Uncharacterised protein [BD1-7 clade bacterium]
MELSSRTNRLLAQIIDAISIAIILSPLLYFGYQNGYINFDDPNLNSIGFEAATALVGFLAYFAMNFKLLKNHGQTIGKRALYIKIVNQDGSATSLKDLIFKRILFQWGVGYIPVIGGIISIADSLTIFGKKRECLHDKIAKTKVVYV